MLLEILVVVKLSKQIPFIPEEVADERTSSMRIPPPAIMLLLLVISVEFVAHVSAGFVRSRSWHEEFVIHTQNPLSSADSATGKKTLYPRFKICRAPKEKPEKINSQSVQSSAKTSEVAWAEMLTIYSADSGAEIYNWDLYKQVIDPKKASRMDQLVSCIWYFCSIIVVFTIFIFFIPTFGRLFFKFYSLTWQVIFHPEVRRICRRILITREKVSRKRIKLLLRKGDRSGRQRTFRLPFFLREYNDEEIPAELQVEDEEDSEGEASSDGFENMLVTGAKTTTAKSKLAKTKNLVHLMADTEKEELGLETGGETEPETEAEREHRQHRRSFLDRIHNHSSSHHELHKK